MRPAIWRLSAGLLMLAATTVASGFWGTAAYAQDRLPGPIGSWAGGISDSGRISADPSSEYNEALPTSPQSVEGNDQEEPVVSITVATSEVTEGEDAVFRLSRSGLVSDPLLVGLQVGGHRKIMSAETVDITLTSENSNSAVDATVTFEVGASEVVFHLTTQDDNVNEGDGLLTVRIARFDSSPYQLGDARSAEVLVKDNDVPTVSIAMPELPEGMTLSDSGDTWEGSLTEGEAISFTIVCTGDFEYLPFPDLKRTYFTWVQEMNHPAFYTASAIDRGIIGNNETGFSQMFNCQDRTVPDPVGARRRFVGPDGGEVRIDMVPSNVGFSQTLRDLKYRYEAAAEEAKRLGVPLTAPGLFAGVRDTFIFQCDDELRFCPSYEVGSPNSIRVRVVNRDPVILIKSESDAVTEGQAARFTLERLWNEENLGDTSPGWADTLVLIETSVAGTRVTDDLPSEITFGRNETTKTIELATVADSAFNDPGSVTVAILPDTTGADQNLAAKYTTAVTWLGHTPPGGRSDRATVTVTDGDGQILSVGFGEASYGVAEGGSVEVVVLLGADPGRDVVVSLSVENQGGVSDADYSGVPGSVTFVSGVTEQTFVFEAVQDMFDDDGEAVVVGFGTLPAGVEVGTEGVSTVAITDDDRQGVVASPEFVEMVEGESASYMVMLTAQPTEAVTISVIDPANPDIAAEPESLTFTVDDWDDEQMVTVYALQDADPEDETGRITHGVDGGEYVTMDAPTVSVMVLDDDPDCHGTAFWCATVEFADRSATDWGFYDLFYHRSTELPSNLTDTEFVYNGRIHTVVNMHLAPGIPPDSDSPPTGRDVERSTFHVSIMSGRWGQAADTGVPASDYLNWTLHAGDVELPFRDSDGPTRSDGRRGSFGWRGSVVQGLFSDWPAPTSYEVWLEETPYSEQLADLQTRPDPPRYLEVSPVDGGELLARWWVPTDDGGSRVTGYRIEWKEARDSWEDPNAVLGVQAPPALGHLGTAYIAGLTTGVDYTVRVLAMNDLGSSAPSNEYAGRPQTHTPRVSGATVDGDLLTLRFDRMLDESSVPATDAFRVLVNGGLRRVESVEVQGDTVRLVLSMAVSGADEVHVRHVPPTDLADPDALRDTDGNLAVSLNTTWFEEVSNETDRSTIRPLTARFVDFPDSHNGSDSFTFRVEFSESVWMERGTPRTDMIIVTGGKATSGWWLDRHTGVWEFTVQPDSDGDVTVVLPAERVCGTVGAPCASGDRRLSTRLELTVGGPGS